MSDPDEANGAEADCVFTGGRGSWLASRAEQKATRVNPTPLPSLYRRFFLARSPTRAGEF